MARYHIPGPLNASRGNHAIQDGTLQRTPGMLPGPIGGAHASHASAWDPRIYIARAEAVRDAVRIGIRRAPDAILEETGHAIGDLVRGLIPGLLMTMAVEGICAVVGGAAGGLVGAAVGALAGGVGAAPGAVAGAATGVELGMSLGAALLTWLGLGFLLVSVGEGLLELTTRVYHATMKAWDACDSGNPVIEVNLAGEALARAVGKLFQLILTAIVARLTMRVETAANAAASTVKKDVLAQLADSKLGKGFAKWVADNEQALLRNPKLRGQAKPKASEKPVEGAQTPSQVKKQAKKDGGEGGDKPPTGKQTTKRKPKRRCELVPYDELQCEPGQQAHHVVPDWMLRMGKRGGEERIPGMPSLASGPAICLEGGSGEAHNVAHRHTDRPAERIARSGRTTGMAGTLKLGQAKVISARAIEKATGGKQGGGCDRQDIRQQLDQHFRSPEDSPLRGVKDARKVTESLKEALKPTGPRGK